MDTTTNGLITVDLIINVEMIKIEDSSSIGMRDHNTGSTEAMEDSHAKD